MMATKSLLSSLLDGSEESAGLVIHDTRACNGRALLKFGVLQLIKRFDLVHVFLFELERDKWFDAIPKDMRSRMIIHDFTSAWLEGKKLDDLSSLYQPSTHQVTSQVTSQRGVAFVIDSLSSLLLHQPSHNVCHWLASKDQSISLLHSDLHSEGVIAQIQYISTSTLKLSKMESLEDNDHVRFEGIVQTIHKKLSGKILKQRESYSIDTTIGYTSMNTRDYSQHIKTNTTTTIDPAANLTFDLHLTAEEREQRSHVVLPYTTAQQSLVGISQGSGKIFYELDAMDSFDDSDPDEDLDF